MAITYVGGKTASHNVSSQTISLTDLTGGSDAAPATGDIVIVINGHPEVSDTNVSVTTTGYTNQELYDNDTRDANGAFCYKVMGGTPDTDVTVPGTSGSSVEGSTVIKVFRGVDTITPLDVATTTATGINGSRADSPSITPTTSGAKILALGHGTHPASNSAAVTGPANMSGFLTISAAGGGRSSWAGIAEFDWTSGAFDPDAVTGGGGTVNDSWVAFTVALRPAAGGDSGAVSFSGAAAVSAVGASTAAASASVAGVGAASAVGAAASAASASASGIGAASAVGASSAAAVATAAGVATVSAVAGTDGSVATAAGAATVSAIGASTVSAVATAAGVATVSAVSGTVVPVAVRRGDDGGSRYHGARERFWREQAEKWLEEYLERVGAAAKKPASARKRSAKRLLTAGEAMAAEMPALAPRIDLVGQYLRRLAEPKPDLSAIAAVVAVQLEQMEADRRARRRKRDLEAVLLLAA